MSTLAQALIYANGSNAQLKVHRAGTIAAGLAVLCIAYSVVSALWLPARNQLVSGGIAAVWAVGAPLWFWYEYFFIYRGKEGGLPDSFENFKHGQQTAIAIWAGLSAALGAYAVSDFSKAPAQTYICRVELLRGVDPSSTTVLVKDVTLQCTRGAA
jgi:hypothetical protein